MELDVHDETGKVVGKVTLDEKRLGVGVRRRLLREASLMYASHRHLGTAKAKSKAERAGSGVKPWPQKHTGRARAGMKRSPLWRKGGRIHPPKVRDFSFDIPRKARRAATRSALLAKLKDSEVTVINGLDYKAPKTSRMAATLKALGIKGSCLVTVLPGKGEDGRLKQQVLYKSIRNIPKIHLLSADSLNAYDLLRHRRILVTKDVVERLAEVLP
jgi:large subunit ribosomal protein L4